MHPPRIEKRGIHGDVLCALPVVAGAKIDNRLMVCQIW
jgi:hypothetical protein